MPHFYVYYKLLKEKMQGVFQKKFRFFEKIRSERSPSRLFLCGSLDARLEVATDRRDGADHLGPYGSRRDLEHAEGLEAERALVLNVAQTVDEALPIEIGVLTPIVRLRVGEHMQVLDAVVVVDVETGETASEGVQILTDVRTDEVCVTGVEAEAEALAVSLGVEQVDVESRLLSGCAGAADDVTVEGGEEVFKADLHAVLLCRGDHALVHL